MDLVQDAALSGLITGWAIAVPIGAVGAFLVTLASRTSLRVGAAGALGIATIDGLYAALAVVAGSAVAAALEPVAHGLAVVSGLVLLVIAAGIRWRGAWLPRAVVQVAAVAVLALAVVNPDALIVRHNAAMSGVEQGPESIDLGYLRSLSADAVPAAEDVAEPARSASNRRRCAS